MKKILFFTALFAFVAGTTVAVSTHYTSEVSIENSIKEGEKDKKGKKKADDKSKSSETTTTTTTTTSAKDKNCSPKQCCKKDSKAQCNDKKKSK